MTYDEVVRKLAPCGLDCSRCADYQDGEIKELSAKLLDLLEGYERLATLKSTIIPAFKGYGEFKELLELFAHVSCGGCRSENVKCPVDCPAKICHKEKGVDFCFQCDEFPCDREFEGNLREQWITNNQRMKEIGVVNFYMERSKLPRH
jgi:hypothetical protein